MKDQEKKPEIVEEPTEEEKTPRDAVILTGGPRAAMKPDIKYRGFMSYRWLRVLGWLTFAVSQIAVIMGLYAVLKPGETGEGSSFAVWRQVLSFFGNFMMPMFILANISLILRERQSYKKLLLMYAAMVGGVIIGFYYIEFRFILPYARLFAETPEEAEALVNTLFNVKFAQGVNIFLDLGLCTLFAFFVNYQPKKLFQGKKIYIFRSFAFLVVCYEIASFVLKILHVQDVFMMPHWIMPWLPAKPPIIFFAFVVIAFFIKLRERAFLKHGGTKEQFEDYRKTNRGSFRVSIFMSVVFAIAAIIDLIVLVVVTAALLNGSETEETIMTVMARVFRTGIGGGLALILVSPIILLFDYMKEHKNPKIDKFIPIGGIVLVVIVYFEGFIFVLRTLLTMLQG